MTENSNLILSAVPKDSYVPNHFRARYVGQHRKRTDWSVIETANEEIKISLVRERRSRGLDVAPTLMTSMCELTETACSWYATGNPFEIEEIITFFAKVEGPSGSAQFRNLSLCEELAADLGIAQHNWAAWVPGSLPDWLMPQNRWLDVSLLQARAWIEDWLNLRRAVVLGPRIPRPADGRSDCIYLTAADTAGEWVKVGKAKAGASTASRRMQAQQLCSRYRLRHLGLWSVDTSRMPLSTAEALLLRCLASSSVARRSEWVNIQTNTALGLADELCERLGFRKLDI